MQTINIEDLSCGDLVNVLTNNMHSEVVCIDKDSGIVTVVPIDDSGIESGKSVSCSIASACEIPLSYEMLDSNFPDYEEGDEIGYWGDECCGFLIELSTPGTEIVKHNVQSVRELQHMMRLCGLNKKLKI